MSELKRLGARSTNLIDRQETIDRFNVIRPVDPKKDEYTKGIDVGIAMCIVAVKDQPTIQTEKAQLSQEGTTSDLIRKFIDGLEETFAHIREREGGDSVCGLCEYDGAYIGESGDWCNECPGFNRDDCFKLSDETRRKWTDEILKALPPAQPESQWILCSERMPEEHEWIGTKKFGTTISDEVYVTFENEKGERFCKHLSFQNGELSRYDKVYMEAWHKGSKPIAWMPLPEPYKPNNK